MQAAVFREVVMKVGRGDANASAVLACMQNKAIKRRKIERIMVLLCFVMSC